MFEFERHPESTTSQRVERKYPLPGYMLDRVIAELRQILPVYHHAGSHDWSSMRTIYLDTEDLQCYQEYQQRVPVRRKIRIRQYGVNGVFDDVCWVEIKVKNHKMSLKRRFRCQTGDLAELVEGRDILRKIVRQNPRDVSQTYQIIRSMILEQDLSPVIEVEYERLSFQPPDSNGLRVTVDRDVRFASPCRSYQGDLDGLIVEIKHHGDKPPWMKEMCARLGMRRVKRFSKFARSVKQLVKLREREEVL